MKRSGFKPKYVRREKKYVKPDTSSFRNPEPIKDEDFVSDEKSVAHRNPALLEMARGRECIACTLSGVAICTPDSVVAAHSNQGIHGKAKGRKADDFWSVWLGYEHHHFLDASTAEKEIKVKMFADCHAKQVDLWEEVAYSSSESARFKQAALWALNHLKEC